MMMASSMDDLPPARVNATGADPSAPGPTACLPRLLRPRSATILRAGGRRNGRGPFPGPRPRAAMLPREVLRQIRRLQLRARRAVEDLLGGEYHSVFKGTGIAFEEVRGYQPGDDIRAIDWNVTARMGHPFVKRFIEERELTVVLAVDCSGSQQFGTRLQPKREVAAELAAVLAFSAISNNDRVGLVAFTDRVEHFVPPRKGT